ncbi:MAG: hypothetical protein EBS47_00515 [Betaproteobacteria bacterium]|nr:hypothetical protein [Betaproteobacteria bacterium]NBU48584.1 hypothetical protein [Betaproteobacteria bacterium]
MLGAMNRSSTTGGVSRLAVNAVGRQRGVALLEWMVANSLGLMVVTAALGLFLHQARGALALHQRQLQLQDLGAVTQALRSELRMAGHRRRSGAQAPYDHLRVEHGATPGVAFLCDACGASDPNRPAGIRLQAGVLMHRGQSAGSYQALHDAPTSAWRRWQVAQGQTADCLSLLHIRLEPLGSETASMALTIRPRNLGPLACEHLAAWESPRP